MSDLDRAVLRLHPEERLRLIEENVQDYAIFVIDTHGRIASWNRGAEGILGYTEQEALGLHCRELFTPEDRARGAVEMERAIADEVGRAVDERWHLRKDGTRFWGNGIMTALKDERGDLRGHVKILRDETLRKKAQDALAREQEKRIEQESRNAVLQERNRIAQEIHDTLAQSLTAIHLQLEALRDLFRQEDESAHRKLDNLQELVRNGLTETRRSVRALRPQLLEANSLTGAFLRMAEEIRSGASLEVTCLVQGEVIVLPPQVEDQLLRIGQEAITNVLRHADATKLELILRFEPESLTLEIQDNGQGFEPQPPWRGFGLIGIQERAKSIGGQTTLISAPGKGTRISVTAPLDVPQESV
ncbi:MAG: sensor signal transduction histidine kinase [Chthonomonadales bacterium]|nr:sensor signal transduction histidine kinase [Chthonomonadales bacterium]